jgi:hypothetical protein
MPHHYTSCHLSLYTMQGLPCKDDSPSHTQEFHFLFLQNPKVYCCDWTIGVLGFESRQGLGIFLFTTASRTALGPTQLPIKWVPGALSLGVKWPGREADHSPPYGAEVKECVELYLHSPNTPTWRGAQLKHRDNFTLTLPQEPVIGASLSQLNQVPNITLLLEHSF